MLREAQSNPSICPCPRRPRQHKSLAIALLTFVGAGAVCAQSLDTFNPGANYEVQVIAVQPDNKILIGGDIATLAGQPCRGLGRVHADGNLDTTFSPGATGVLTALALQPDQKILIGGSLQIPNQTLLSHLARLNADGTLDSTFTSQANANVQCIALQPDGKVLVAGGFTTLGGVERSYLGRLNADSTLDASFNPGADRVIFAMALQPDGKILVGGGFTNLCGDRRVHLGRLNSDGTLDTSFRANLGYGWSDTVVYSLLVQPDGKIIVGGRFQTLAGELRANIGRLNADGSLDTSFNPGADGNVGCIALQADGKMLIGGGFSTLGGQACRCVGRLNGDGSPDTTFDAQAEASSVAAIALQADGKILLGGNFVSLKGQPHNYIGRLDNTAPATQSLLIDKTAITWLRGGSSPEVERTSFELSANGTDWVSLGAGTRIPGGWRLTNTYVSGGALVRAQGRITIGSVEGSSWYVQSTMQAPSVPAAILVHDGSFGFTSREFGFHLSGNVGQVIIVDGSADLVQWTPMSTNALGTQAAYFGDPASQSAQRRFYRARVQ